MKNIIEVTIPASAPKQYTISVAPGLLNSLPETLRALKPASQYVIITDSNVEKLYGEKVLQTLQKAGLACTLLSFSAGEKHKNSKTHLQLCDKMFEQKCGRDTMILALGGGVVGDVAGYVAATFMRGVPFVQIPTSSLAMIDSSIGGKVAVDTKHGKNMLGAFAQPKAVIADIDCLKTLPKKHLANGLIEALKIFMTHDKEMFEFMKKDRTAVEKIIPRAVELKADVVMRDELEANERMVLNFGHTIGHAIEALSNFKLLHGMCVGLGILVESKISQLLGVLTEADFLTIQKTLGKFGIREKALQKFSIDAIIEKTKLDKKSRDGQAKYVILKTIGEVQLDPQGLFAHQIDDQIVRQALQFFNS